MITHYTRLSDGADVAASVALDSSGTIRAGYRKREMMSPGERVTFNMAFCDTAARADDDVARRLLTDGSTPPSVRLVDADTGGAVRVNAAIVDALKAEAKRLGMPLQQYLADVVRYREQPL